LNFAFQAFLLLLIYLPGAIFVLAVTGKIRDNGEIPVISGSMTGHAIAAVLASAVLHTAWLLAIHAMGGLCGCQPAHREFFALLTLNNATAPYLAAESAIGGALWFIALYFISIFALPLVAGLALNVWIDRRELDIRYRFLRFKPPWHYILTGENRSNQAGRTVVVDLLVQVGEAPVLYSGILSYFSFDEKTKAPDALVLASAFRGVVPDFHGTAEPEFLTPIPGDTFAVKFSEIKNINIQYVDLVDA
jgi:hypothetical protein